MKFIVNRNRDKVSELIELIANLFGFSETDIYKKRRTRDYVCARFCVYHVLRNNLKLSFSEVGRLCHRDHGSIMHGVKALDDWCATEELAKETRISCEELASKWVIERGYFKNNLGTKCELPVDKSIKAVNTKQTKTKGKPKAKSGLIPSILSSDEKTTYTYYYNNNKYITYTLTDQLHNTEFFKSIREFIQYRKESGKRLTQRGMDILMAKLSSENAALVIEAIETSMANGWQGVFLNNKNNAKNNKTNNSEYNIKAKADYSGAVKQRATQELGEVF